MGQRTLGPTDILLDKNEVEFVRNLRTSGVAETTAPVTYYVRADGSDSKRGLTETTALRQIQTALDKLPARIAHACVIDVGEGDFDGFVVSGYQVVHGGSITVTGVIDAPTLDGATSGTGGTGSTELQLVDATAAWTVDECKGKLIYVAGEYKPIYSNTSDTLQFVGRVGPAGFTTDGEDYEIFECKTTCNTVVSGTTCVIGLTNNMCHSDDSIMIQNIRADGVAASSTYTARVYQNTGGILERCDIYGGSRCSYFSGAVGLGLKECVLHDATGYGMLILECPSIRQFDNVYVYGCGSHGMYVRCTALVGGNWYASSGNTGDGIQVLSCPWVDLDGGQFESNGGHGIRVGRATDNLHGKAIMSLVGTLPDCIKLGGNTAGGLIVEADSSVYLANLTGTATGDYGVEGTSGSKICFKNGLNVTGAVGDVTINGGVNVWAWTDFLANLDDGKNHSDNTYILRDD